MMTSKGDFRAITPSLEATMGTSPGEPFNGSPGPFQES